MITNSLITKSEFIAGQASFQIAGLPGSLGNDHGKITDERALQIPREGQGHSDLGRLGRKRK